MEFTNRELATLHGVLETELLKPYRELNTQFGSMTIEDMATLKHKIYQHLVDEGVFASDDEWL